MSDFSLIKFFIQASDFLYRVFRNNSTSLFDVERVDIPSCGSNAQGFLEYGKESIDVVFHGQDSSKQFFQVHMLTWN